MNRRRFLLGAAGAMAGTLLGRAEGFAGGTLAEAPKGDPQAKLIVALFGGGTRCSETIDDPEHRYIPRLWNEMVPCGTLFTNMRVEHRVVHPNSAGSIVTGHWEWDDLDWSRPVAHPTLFERYRKVRGAGDAAAWAFVYASILVKAGESLAPGYGPDYAANVVEPPTIPRSTAEQMDRVMRRASASGRAEEELEAAQTCAQLARQTSRIDARGLRSPSARDFLQGRYEAWKSGAGTTSHDAFLCDLATACMRRFAPPVMLVAFGEVDCAHYGSWSRYVEAIARTDELMWRLWRQSQEMPDYRGRTLMLILPDHGRELDEPGPSGFIHHSNFYTGEGADEGCRRVWMLALGPQVEPGSRVERPIPITSVAATGLEHLGLEGAGGAERSVWEHIRAG
jgi:hypothetical protein